MPDKKHTVLPLPDDLGGDFEEEDFILNYKPVIEYVEPDQEYFEPEEVEPEPSTIDEARDRTQKLIHGFRGVEKLCDIAQKRLDARVEASGGMNVKLDEVKDAHVIAAMKRHFPKKADPSVITYDEYKQAIDCLANNATVPPFVSPGDIQKAQSDPNRTSFGGSDNQQGENRAEISSPGGSVSPLNLGAFQSAAVIALFGMMLPLIKAEDKKEILEHLITVPHKPI